MANDLIEILNGLLPKAGQFDRMNDHLKGIEAALKGGSAYVDDVAEIVANVKAGLGPRMYPSGTIFNSPRFSSAAVSVVGTGVSAASIDGRAFCEALGYVKGGIYELSYDGAWKFGTGYVNPASYGITVTGTPANGDRLIVTITATDYLCVVLDHNKCTTVPAKPHMSCVALNVIYGRPFDDQEAFESAEEAVPAGTYSFTVPETIGSWTAGTYQFTTTASHAAGSMFRISGQWNTALTSLSVQVFDSAGSASASETCAISAGSGGTSLGTFGTELNHTHRVAYGSNNYAQSNIRQYINSEAAAGAYLTKQTKYDMFNGTYRTLDGFLRDFGRNFKDALLPTEITCATNTVFETDMATGSSYTVRDKMFLLSMTELGWGKNNNVSEGSLLEYYDGASNADRIKYDISSGVARNWWLRSCNPSGAYSARIVNSDGSLSYSSAIYGFGLVPAFNLG